MQEKYVLITGAAGGIGKATSNYFASKGITVFACDINEHSLNSFTSEKIIPISMDVTEVTSIKLALNQVRKITNQIHGLINIAGKFDQFPLAEADSRAFNCLININLIGPQQITKACFPLLDQAKGRVINLSSETVLAQMPLQSYGFSKKLFDVWNTQLRMELSLLDLRVIVIRAGGHQTPFIEESSKIIGAVDKKSRYANLLKEIKNQGLRLLNKKQNDPADLAMVFYKALTVKKPKKVYYVNVSLLFRLLSLLPEGMRESLMIRKLKSWM